MYYQVRMYVYTYVCLCINLPLTSTLVGGDVKGVLYNSSKKPHASPRFTWYNGVYYITSAWRY